MSSSSVICVEGGLLQRFPVGGDDVSAGSQQRLQVLTFMLGILEQVLVYDTSYMMLILPGLIRIVALSNPSEDVQLVAESNSFAQPSQLLHHHLGFLAKCVSGSNRFFMV